MLALSRGINRDLVSYRRLKELLDSQFDAAMHHDAVRLVAAGLAVEQLAGEIEVRRQERIDLLRQLFDSDSRASMEQVFELLPEAPSRMFRNWWSTLEAMVRDCKAQNERTCRLLTDQQEIMQRILGDREDIYVPL